ncbi:hypothetical protein [Streptomyces sp. NPDC048650]|uniref:hypothetical protein n=1 Tax=Streptomyces sp. NPDC048650 TaxID=3365583 RepID=UPI003717FC0B
MSGTQLQDSVVEFAEFLNGLVRRIDPSTGWYAVFAGRDPEGLRACLEGRDVPPWDVVESLLHDLAGLPGEHAGSAARPRAQRLHARAVAGHDARPGARSDLHGRLAAMLYEQRRAARRTDELRATAQAAAGFPEALRLGDELAWAQDDHARAGARVGELRSRLEALDEAAERRRPRRESPRGAAARRPARPRGARFAGLEAPEGVGEAKEVEGAEEVEGAGEGGIPAAGPAPRGARFAGAYGEESAGDGAAAGGTRPEAAPVTPEARLAAATAAARLVRLRATGDGGLAYAELCAAAHRAPEEIPLLIAELEHAGLASEVPTLLWEAACLPPAGLAAAADALVAAGRTEDGARMLRQAVTRPAAEVARATLALLDRDRAAPALELLAAFVGARTPQEAAQAAEAAPGVLGPLLLTAAERVSPHRRGDVAHALRAARL